MEHTKPENVEEEKVKAINNLPGQQNRLKRLLRKKLYLKTKQIEDENAGKYDTSSGSNCTKSNFGCYFNN